MFVRPLRGTDIADMRTEKSISLSVRFFVPCVRIGKRTDKSKVVNLKSYIIKPFAFHLQILSLPIIILL